MPKTLAVVCWLLLSCIATSSFAQGNLLYSINEIAWSVKVFPAPVIDLYAPPLYYAWQSKVDSLLKIGTCSNNQSAYAINAYVTQLHHQESLTTDSLVQARLKISVAFGLIRNSDTLSLFTYRGSLAYQRSRSYAKGIDKALAKAVENCLNSLQEWLVYQAPINPILARGVELKFNLYPGKSSADTLYYSPGSPLQWGDFKGQPLGNRYAATVFPTFEYSGSHAIENGVLVVRIFTKVYVIKEYSWARPELHSSYALEHEQRHFDIVRLAVESFKNNALSEKYLPEDYPGRLAYFYLETLKKINRRQELYDKETQHGLNKSAQFKWNSQLTKELNRLYADDT